MMPSFRRSIRRVNLQGDASRLTLPAAWTPLSRVAETIDLLNVRYVVAPPAVGLGDTPRGAFLGVLREYPIHRHLDQEVQPSSPCRSPCAPAVWIQQCRDPYQPVEVSRISGSRASLVALEALSSALLAEDPH